MTSAMGYGIQGQGHKPGLSFADLDAIAHAMTDNQAAEQLNRERGKLFQLIKSKKVA